MHVGIVVYGGLDRTSGGYRYDRKLTSYLERCGDTVEVLALPRRSYPRHLADGLSRSLRSRLNRPFDVLLQDELCHPSLWRHNPRLDRPGATVAIVHLPRSAGTTTRPPSVVRTVERRYLESVDAAVCTSRDTRDRTVDLASVPTLVAPPSGRNGGAATTPDAVRARAHAGRLRVAFVGNLVPRKGLLELLSGLARVDGEWELIVVGSHEANPAYARRAVELADSLGLERRIEFTGEVDASGLEAVLERSHVLAVPSRYEGFGMVYLEAMEYGVVPIASAVGGADEIVEDAGNGFLASPDVPGRIAGIVATLDADRERLATLGVEALETAAEHPDWNETLSRVRSFLATRVDGRDSTGSSRRTDANGARSSRGERP